LSGHPDILEIIRVQDGGILVPARGSGKIIFQVLKLTEKKTFYFVDGRTDIV
jgi:hypothetical protein